MKERLLFLIFLPAIILSQESWKPLFFPNPVNAEFIAGIDGKLFVNNSGLYVSTDNENFVQTSIKYYCKALVKYKQKFISLSGSGILESQDGINWTVLKAGIYGYTLINVNDTLYIGNNTGVIRSFDGGLTWQDFIQHSAGVERIVHHKGRIFALCSNVLRSVSVSGNDSLRHHLPKVYAMAENPEVIVAADDKNLKTSSDGGVTWQIHPAPVDGNRIIKIIKDSTGFIYLSNRALFTSTFTNFNLSLKRIFNFDVYNIWKSGQKYFASSPSSFLLSEDDAISWKPLFKGLHNMSLMNQIIPHNQHVFFKAYNELYRSEDELTYTPVPMPNSDIYGTVNSVNNLLFSPNVYGSTWKISRDNGDSWINIQIPHQDIRAFLKFKDKVVCYTTQKIFLSDTAVFSWEEMNVPPNNYIYSVISTDSALYVSSNGQSEPHLLVTSDLGNTWVVNHAPYIGNLSHAMGKLFILSWEYSGQFTSDNGASWQSKLPGLPITVGNWSSPPDKIISITDHKDETYCVYRHINQQMTYHVGVYRKLKNDTMWSEFNNGIQDYVLTYPYVPQQIFSNNRSLYLSIGSKGIWRYGNVSNSVVGVKETVDTKATEVKIYPNPATETVKLFTEFSSDLKIFNSLGKCLLFEPLNAGENIIYTGALSPGLYVFSVRGKQSSKNIKVVISN